VIVIPLGVVFALSLLAGCQSAPTLEPVREVEIVEVKVPVPVRVAPPAELMGPLVLDDPLPTWLPPSAPGVTSALDGDGETRLKLILLRLLTERAAWQEWASEYAD
jgi:hypothetical protein